MMDPFLEEFDEKVDSLVLVVDDVPQNLKVVGRMLRYQGYEVAIAGSGRQALEMIADTPPDLVLLDIMMPEMDGFEVNAILKASEETKAIPVIFLTAKTAIEEMVSGLEAGAVDYIFKPFKAPELLARVKTHLEVKRQRDLIVRYAKNWKLK